MPFYIPVFQVFQGTVLSSQALAQPANKEVLLIKGHFSGKHFAEQVSYGIPYHSCQPPHHLVFLVFKIAHPYFVAEKSECREDTCSASHSC